MCQNWEEFFFLIQNEYKSFWNYLLKSTLTIFFWKLWILQKFPLNIHPEQPTEKISQPKKATNPFIQIAECIAHGNCISNVSIPHPLSLHFILLRSHENNRRCPFQNSFSAQLRVNKLRSSHIENIHRRQKDAAPFVDARKGPQILPKVVVVFDTEKGRRKRVGVN